LAKIPGVGDYIKAGADKLQSFREKYLGAEKRDLLGKMAKNKTQESASIINKTLNRVENFNRNVTQNIGQQATPRRRAPNEAEVRARRIDFQGRIDIAGAPEGTKIESETRGAPAILLELLGVQ
jgi:hypothetical protein